MAVGCHPDDVEIGCGGTLAKYASLGHEVFTCHMANGNRGHAVIMPDELREMRTIEAEQGGALLGAKEVFNVDVDDVEVDSSNMDTVKKTVDIIRYVKPDVIITHGPDDYMTDHIETGKIVFNASFSSSVPHLFTEHDAWGKVVPIYYMDTLAGVNFLPTDYVDITNTIDVKLNAIDCHVSQIKWMKEHDHIDFLDFVKTVSKFRGLQCGVAFAEGFKLCATWPRIPVTRLLP